MKKKNKSGKPGKTKKYAKPQLTRHGNLRTVSASSQSNN